MVDSYMHWHHTGTRRGIARLSASVLIPELHTSKIEDHHKSLAESTLTKLNTNWLGGGGNSDDAQNANGTNDDDNNKYCYLAGTDYPTIADILAYEELIQIQHVVSSSIVDLSTYTNVWSWMERMKQLPYHEHVHKPLEVFSSTAGSDLPLQKRLGDATKAGLKAINEAQDTYKGNNNLSSKL